MAKLVPTLRRAGQIVAALLLVGLAWWACAGAIANTRQAHTLGQRVETLVQFATAALALGSALTAFVWRRWGRAVRASWTAALAVMAALSALVWGPPFPLVALGFAVIALLVALGIGWLLRGGTPAPPSRTPV